jgi:4-hydroxy-2-oxoheptanedioate aldolase
MMTDSKAPPAHNRVKRLLGEGKVVVGAQLRFGSPAIAELFGHAGFDYLVLDAEHAPQTAVGIQSQLQAIGCTSATPFVRLRKNDPDLMRPYLDMGALGILAPFVNTAEEARLGARAMRYPPVGARGYGPARASKYGFYEAYVQYANDEVFYMMVVEDALAVKNIDEILAVDGMDSFVIGPCDLSFSLGVPMQLDHPKVKDAIQTVIRAAQKAGKPMGTAVYGGDMFHPDTYKRFVDQGFNLLLVGGDEWMMNYSCSRLLDAVSSAKH